MKKMHKLAEAINGMNYEDWQFYKQFIESEFVKLQNSNVLVVDDRMLRNLSQVSSSLKRRG